jgi:hypothetical protein
MMPVAPKGVFAPTTCRAATAQLSLRVRRLYRISPMVVRSIQTAPTCLFLILSASAIAWPRRSTMPRKPRAAGCDWRHIAGGTSAGRSPRSSRKCATAGAWCVTLAAADDRWSSPCHCQPGVPGCPGSCGQTRAGPAAARTEQWPAAANRRGSASCRATLCRLRPG